MTSTNHKPFDLDVEAFSLRAGETSIHFEADPDLGVGVARALGHQPGKPLPSQAALVLVELGIDGYRTHRVRVERTGNFPGPNDAVQMYDDESFNFERNDHEAIIEETVTALQALLDQLLVMRTPEQVAMFERTAYEAGVDNHADGIEQRSTRTYGTGPSPAADRCRCGMAADALVHNATANGHDYEGENQ